MPHKYFFVNWVLQKADSERIVQAGCLWRMFGIIICRREGEEAELGSYSLSSLHEEGDLELDGPPKLSWVQRWLVLFSSMSLIHWMWMWSWSRRCSSAETIPEGLTAKGCLLTPIATRARNIFFLLKSLTKDIFIDFRKRKGKRERENERERDTMCESNTNWLPPSHTPTGDWTSNLGMVWAQTGNRTHNLAVYGTMLQLTEPPGQGRATSLMWCHWKEIWAVYHQ